MARRDLDIAIRAIEDLSETLRKVGAETARAASVLEGAYGGAAEAGGGFSGGGSGSGRGSARAAGSPRSWSTDLLWFAGGTDEEHEARASDYFKRSKRWAEELTNERIALAEKEYLALKGFNLLHEESADARKNTVNSAYSAMEEQMLSLVETGRFSAKEFGKAVAQQVKVELTGLAARSAVWAIFETAMGFKDLAVGSPTAALHFKSAAEFAAVSAASLAGAAGVQAAFFGGHDKGPSGSSGGGAAGVGPAPLPAPAEPEETKPTQHITVNIHNPLSEQNWQDIAERNIAPALKDLKDRNVEITFS